jgi:hypothetical protein
MPVPGQHFPQTLAIGIPQAFARPWPDIEQSLRLPNAFWLTEPVQVGWIDGC